MGIPHSAAAHWHDSCSRLRQERKLWRAIMMLQTQNYRSATNFSNIDALSYDGDYGPGDNIAPELAETLDLDMTGLSDAMMDDLREMIIY